jgi:segregation and condensation protein B
MDSLSGILEALLFVSGNAVEIKDIAEKLLINEQLVTKAAESLQKKYGKESGIQLLMFSDKLQFSSNPSYADAVSGVLNPIKERELSQSMMEVVSIIAYKQPITRLEIEEIRGVNSDYAISMLSKHNLIEVVGRKNAVGKPVLFGTADNFLKRFQLKNLKELPDYDSLIERIKVIDQENFVKNDSDDLYYSNRDNTQEEIV